MIKFEYCGGWGYRRQAVAAIAKIEQEMAIENGQKGGLFQYNLYKDKFVSGRLEATLYVNTKDDWSPEGIVLHSKE